MSEMIKIIPLQGCNLHAPGSGLIRGAASLKTWYILLDNGCSWLSLVGLAILEHDQDGCHIISSDSVVRVGSENLVKHLLHGVTRLLLILLHVFDVFLLHVLH